MKIALHLQKKKEEKKNTLIYRSCFQMVLKVRIVLSVLLLVFCCVVTIDKRGGSEAGRRGRKGERGEGA